MIVRRKQIWLHWHLPQVRQMDLEENVDVFYWFKCVHLCRPGVWVSKAQKINYFLEMWSQVVFALSCSVWKKKKLQTGGIGSNGHLDIQNWFTAPLILTYNQNNHKHFVPTLKLFQVDEHTMRSDFVLGFKGARDSILCYISKTNTASEQHILTSNKSKLHSRHDFFVIIKIHL